MVGHTLIGPPDNIERQSLKPRSSCHRSVNLAGNRVRRSRETLKRGKGLDAQKRPVFLVDSRLQMIQTINIQKIQTFL